MNKPRPVVDLTARAVHFESGDVYPNSGAGGTTLCGIKFVPRTGMWTRDRAQWRHGRFSHYASCAECVRRHLEAVAAERPDVELPEDT